MASLPAVPVVRTSRSPTSRGVRTMPTRLEIVAPVSAPATLPRAIEVNTTDDCTVDGSRLRNSSPCLVVSSIPGTSCTRRPSTGKTT